MCLRVWWRHKLTEMRCRLHWTKAIIWLRARALVEVWGDGTQCEALPKTQQHAMAQRIHIVAATEDALYNDASGILVSGAR